MYVLEYKSSLSAISGSHKPVALWQHSMKGLGQVEIRCRDHEAYEPKCEICRFLRRAERQILLLRGHRDGIFRQLKERLAKRALIMIDLR